MSPAAPVRVACSGCAPPTRRARCSRRSSKQPGRTCTARWVCPARRSCRGCAAGAHGGQRYERLWPGRCEAGVIIIMPKATKPRPKHRVRIKEHVMVRAGDLIPNPDNWRTHPPQQREALAEVLAEIGHVDEIKVVKRGSAYRIVDGHL